LLLISESMKVKFAALNNEILTMYYQYYTSTLTTLSYYYKFSFGTYLGIKLTLILYFYSKISILK